MKSIDSFMLAVAVPQREDLFIAINETIHR